MRLIIDSGRETTKFGLIDENGLKLYSFPTTITYQDGNVVDYAGLCSQKIQDVNSNSKTARHTTCSHYDDSPRAFLDYLYLIMENHFQISWGDIDSVFVAKDSMQELKWMYKVHPDIKCYAVDIAMATYLALGQDIFSDKQKIVVYINMRNTTWTIISKGSILYNGGYVGRRWCDGDAFGRYNFSEDFCWGDVDSQVERFIKVFRTFFDENIPEKTGINTDNLPMYVISEKELHPLLKSGLSQEFGNRLTIDDDGQFLAVSGVDEMLKDREKYNSLLEEVHEEWEQYPHKAVG